MIQSMNEGNEFCCTTMELKTRRHDNKLHSARGMGVGKIK